MENVLEPVDLPPHIEVVVDYPGGRRGHLCACVGFHSAKSLLCDTVCCSVYSNIRSNISCLRIEHYKQMRIFSHVRFLVS